MKSFFSNQDKFDGWGEAFYENGSIYVGFWQLGKKHGYGKMKAVDKAGNFKEIYSGKKKREGIIVDVVAASFKKPNIRLTKTTLVRSNDSTTFK